MTAGSGSVVLDEHMDGGESLRQWAALKDLFASFQQSNFSGNPNTARVIQVAILVTINPIKSRLL
jgi:hypothetical protein